jgi:hypothetical protein
MIRRLLRKIKSFFKRQDARREAMLHSKAIIAYLQENIEQGYPIYVIVSPDLAESEFGILVNVTGEPISGEELLEYTKKMNGDKYEH